VPLAKSIRRMQTPRSSAAEAKCSCARRCAVWKIESGEIAAVRFDEVREEAADAYVLAVPHTALAGIASGKREAECSIACELGQNNKFRPSPACISGFDPGK